MIPEAQARVQIDQLLQCAGWHVCSIDQVNLQAFPGIAIREFPLNPGHGFADYLLCVNGKACGVIEAKKVRVPLKGVELQSARYAQGLPAALPKRPSGRPVIAARFFCVINAIYPVIKFGEEFIVQHLQGQKVHISACVVICTIQRMFSLLKGKELPPEADEESTEGLESLFKDPEPLRYNPAFPIELFDIVVTDEAHRSIYNLWRQVLEYYDAYLVGLTATPNKQTFGFFNQNLVMEYGHTQAVADGVNVNYDVYRIQTEVTERGAKVEKGFWLETVEKATRRKTAWQLDEDFEYDPAELDRSVQTPDQIRKVITTFRDKLPTEIFPGRTEVPKTLVFAKDDNHAEKIVEILREEFGKGNEFAQKITYRTTGAKPEDLISAFRNSYFPRVAVTVDMIATGTDIKPVEIVMFMRSVKSRSFFEQMKGRGVRVCNSADLQAVTPDAKVKEHFVIVDANLRRAKALRQQVLSCSFNL